MLFTLSKRLFPLTAALPLLLTIVYAACAHGKDGFVLTIKSKHITIVATHCS